MADVEHKTITTTNVHVAHFAEYADATARDAATPSTAEVGKLALKLDDGTLWRLVDDSPLTWAPTVPAAVTSGAAAGATAVQPNTSPTLSGLTLTGLSGVVKAAAGVLSAATIVNADVSSSAAIAGTKIAPDFGSQAVITTGSFTVGLPSGSGGSGASAAAAGEIRLRANTTAIAFRRFDDSGDLSALAISSSNGLTLGNGAVTLLLGGSAITISNATTINSTLTVNTSFSFTSTSVSPTISQLSDASASVTCDDLIITAQSGSGTTSVTGGTLQLKGGSATGGSGTRNGGGVNVQPGTGATADGAGTLKSSGGTTRLSWNSTGLAFFAATPAAQPADLGAPSFSTVGDAQTWCASLRTNVIRALGLTA